EGLPVGPVVVAGAVEDVDRNVLITAALVDVVGRRAPGEVVDIAGDPADALAAGGRVAGEEAEGLGGADVAVVVAAVPDRVGEAGRGGALPPRVALDGDARRAHDLVGGQVERHVEIHEL